MSEPRRKSAIPLKAQQRLDDLAAQFRAERADGYLGAAVRTLTKYNELRSALGLDDDEEDSDDE